MFPNERIPTVSEFLNEKLDSYMNRERREKKFDPDGVYRQKSRLEPFELACKVIKTKLVDGGVTLPRSKSRRSKSPKRSRIVNPLLIDNSRRVVSRGEARRLIETANKIYEATSLEKVEKIHRYRPDRSIPDYVEYGRVQNYTKHVGSILNSSYYIKYYLDEGLDSSDKGIAVRLQNMKIRRKKREQKALPHYNPFQPTTTVKPEKSVTFEDQAKKTPRAVTPTFVPQPLDSDSDHDVWERNSIECEVQQELEQPVKVRKIRLGKRNENESQKIGEINDSNSVHTYASVEHTIGN
ncbi:DgyrCDS13282 [Dimorphilus gyrociliatus]|uniref:DgyrCDS13282 n=1 Tax=Dimorphilus gyrociliatus TaxID=2664684 RepID=A0A7I8WA73_9ANNE|nr:DgyrCDS13282 [Dimorphilus gyrociliatus]